MQRDDRIQRSEPGRFVRLGAASVSGAGICRARQEGAWSDPSVHREDDRKECAAGHAVDSSVPRGRSGGGSSIPATAICGQIQQPGCSAFGGSGSRAHGWFERAGNGAHLSAGIPTVRQNRGMPAWGKSRWRIYTICAAVQATGSLRQNGSQRDRPPPASGSGASPIRRDSPDSCASIRCIKAIGTEPKGVYHINAVDAVTQWQVGCVGRISEQHPMPVLEAPMHLGRRVSPYVST